MVYGVSGVVVEWSVASVFDGGLNGSLGRLSQNCDYIKKDISYLYKKLEHINTTVGTVVRTGAKTLYSKFKFRIHKLLFMSLFKFSGYYLNSWHYSKY
jgi:hypothetical protein